MSFVLCFICRPCRFLAMAAALVVCLPGTSWAILGGSAFDNDLFDQVNLPDAWRAVGRVFADSLSSTGTVISNSPYVTFGGPKSKYVLTCGHCVAGSSASQVRFQLFGTDYSASSIFLHPNFNGINDANDLAVIRLTQVVDKPGMEPAHLNPLIGIELNGALGKGVGYGRIGDGVNGPTGPSGLLRFYSNTIHNVLGPRGTLQTDFDSGSEAHNALGSPTPTATEGALAPGDSGGPLFIGGSGFFPQELRYRRYIAGVASGGTSSSPTFGFGSINHFARITTANANWIYSIIGGSATALQVVPEPSSLTLVTLCALMLPMSRSRYFRR